MAKDCIYSADLEELLVEWPVTLGTFVLNQEEDSPAEFVA